MAAARLRSLLALTSAIVLVDTMFYAAITPLLPHYVATFGLTKASAGLLSGAYPAGTLAGALPGGLLAARFGVRPTVLLGLGCMVAASVVFAFAPGIAVLDGARVVQGIGGAASWAGALAWLVGAAPRDRRGALLGSALAAAIAGALLGPVLGGAGVTIGPRPTFLAVAALGIALGVAAVVMPAAPPEHGSRLRDVPRALRDARVASGMWLVGLPGLLFGVLGVLAPLRLSALGAGGTAVAAIFLVAAALEAVVSPVVGRLSDRHGRLAPVLAGLAAAIAVLVALPAPHTLALLALLVLLAAPIFGVLWAPAMALLSDGADAVGLDQGLGFALMNLAWGIGQFGGSAGGGGLADATGDTVPYMALAAVCAATLAVLGSRARRLPELGGARG